MLYLTAGTDPGGQLGRAQVPVLPPYGGSQRTKRAGFFLGPAFRLCESASFIGSLHGETKGYGI